jgi:hypothetical protein
MAEDHHEQPEPRMAFVESNEPRMALPRAKTLGPGNQRQVAAVLAATWWREACEAYPLGGAGVARWIGTDRATVHRYGTGEKLLPMRDLIAAPPVVQQRVLRLAGDRLDGPRSEEGGGLVADAILACSEAAQVAVQLERGSLERLDARAIDGLLDLIDSLLDRLTRLRRRIWRERQRRGG